MSTKRTFAVETELPGPSCTVSIAEANQRVAEEAEKAHQEASEKFLRWIPILITGLIAIGSNAVMISYAAGKVEQRLVPLEEHAKATAHSKLVAEFPTRIEFDTRTNQRDREVSEQNARMQRIEDKIDRLLLRSIEAKE